MIKGRDMFYYIRIFVSRDNIIVVVKVILVFVVLDFSFLKWLRFINKWWILLVMW